MSYFFIVMLLLTACSNYGKLFCFSTCCETVMLHDFLKQQNAEQNCFHIFFFSKTLKGVYIINLGVVLDIQNSFSLNPRCCLCILASFQNPKMKCVWKSNLINIDSKSKCAHALEFTSQTICMRGSFYWACDQCYSIDKTNPSMNIN